MSEETPGQVTLDDLLPIEWIDPREHGESITGFQMCTRCSGVVYSDDRGEALAAHERWHAAIEDLTVTISAESTSNFFDNSPPSWRVKGSHALRTSVTPEQRRELVVALGLDPNRAADCTWPAIMGRVQAVAALEAVPVIDRERLHHVVNRHGCQPGMDMIAWVDLQLTEYAELQERTRGLTRGEVERLRRVEQALIDVGAPNRSERGDPGGLTVRWIQRQADLMAEYRRRDQAAGRLTEKMEGDLVEALGLDQNTEFYEALDVVREYVAERSSTVTTVDTGGHRVTVHMDPALPEDWQQQVATVIEQAEDAASEIVTRIAYWLGVGKVHTCEAHCSLEHVEEGLDNTKPVTDQVLSDLLLLVNVTVTPEQLASWTREQREQAANWAGLVHLDASDNDVDVPERPAFLDGPAENTGTPGAPITGFTAPEVAAERREWAAEQFEVCSSLYLHGGTLVSCKAIWEHDRHQNTPTGSGDVVWFDHQAVPSPWPVDQEPPAGITLLADTGAGETLGYLCRVAKHWVWSDKPAIPHSPYQMLPWAEAVLDADGDLIVVRP